MDFTPEERNFYIDPAQDRSLTPTHVLVMRTYAFRRLRIGEVVEVKAKKDYAGSQEWFVTMDGDYVDGAPIIHSDLNPYGATLMSLGEGGKFWLGRAGRARYNPGEVVLDGVESSDGHQLPTDIGSPSMRFQHVVKAAPWARQLLPAAGDSEEVARAKVSLAEAKWKTRRAKTVISLEGITRGWTKDLEELRGSHDLPTLTLGVKYEGTITVNDPTNTSTVDRTVANTLALRLGIEASDVSAQPVISLSLARALDLTVTGAESLDSISIDRVRRSLRSVMGDYSINPRDYTLSPVLRSAS